MQRVCDGLFEVGLAGGWGRKSAHILMISKTCDIMTYQLAGAAPVLKTKPS